MKRHHCLPFLLALVLFLCAFSFGTFALTLCNDAVELYADPSATVEVAYVINRPSDVSSAYPVDVGMNDQNLSTPFTAESAICDIGSAVPELYIPGYSFLGWYNQAEGGERINYYTSTDTTLYAVWQKSKPGLNILTGTAKKADFENDDNTYLIKNTANPFPRYVSNNPYSLENNSSARCLKIDISGKVDHVYCHFPAQLVGGRKYHVEWKSYVENTKNTTAYLYNLGSNSNYFNYGSSGVCKTWPTMSFDLVANKDRDNVGFGYGLAASWSTAEDLGSFSIYFDDIAVIPYYKVTYHVTDTSGTETVSTEYVLPADGLFVPNADIVGDAPTYTVNGNTYGITTAYALNNEDIEVYAVIPKTVEVAYVIDRPSDVSSAYPVDAGMNDQNLSTPFTAESAICDIGSAVPELYIPGYSFLGWYNQAEGGERINYYTSTDTTLYAVWQKNKPGLNILTGTAEKADFENDDNTYLIKNTANPFPRYVSNNPYSLANNSSARCLKMDITGKVDHVYCHFPAQLVGGRKYHVEWKSYVEQTKNTTAFLYNLGKDSTSFNYGSSGVCKTWPTMSFDLVANKDRDNVGFGYGLAASWSTAVDLGSFSIYFDDIAVIPYYKVTYHVTDTSGTETVSTEYVLPADGLFVPNADIVGAAPTYTVNGNTYGITTAYALNNEDIEVYAVIPKTVEVAYVINRPSDVSSAYPVDVGMNDQNLSTPFTVDSAVCAVGSAVPELYIPGYTFMGWYNQAEDGSKIRYYTESDTTLYAVWQKNKPGLNILTGTAEKADFENDDNTYLIKNADNPFPRYVSNNPYSLANNSSARCLKMDISGSVDHVYGNVSAQLVSGRKYHIEWKSYVEYTKNTMAYLYYFGTKNHYFDYGHSGTCRTWPTMSFDMTASENKNYVGFGYCFAASWNTAEDLGSFSVYFDDIAVIPYYKVTYHVTDLSGVETVSTEYVLPADGLFIPNADIVGNAAVYTVNGHTYGMGTAYTLCNEDIDVYINFTDNVQTLTEHSIRTAGTQALRFSGSVSNDIIKCNENSSNIEFGFIVSRSDFMIAAAKKSGVDVNDYKTVLNFDEAKPTTNAEAIGVYVNTYGLPFVYGPSFRWLCPTNETEEGTLEKNQTIQTETGDASFFTAALTGIPETYYKTPICGRTYVKIGELYFYGEVEETSVYDVACEMINDTNNTLDDETKAVIQGIIDKANEISGTSGNEEETA